MHVVLRLKFKRPRLPRLWQGVWARRMRKPLRNVWVRAALIVTAIIVMVPSLIIVLQPYITQHTYALGAAEVVLAPKDSYLGNKLEYDTQSADFTFNKGYSPDTTSQGSGGPIITAVANEDPSKGLRVTDPISNVSFTIKPKFDLLRGRQDGNRIIYPLRDGTGWLVYTMQATSVKEDVVLRRANGDVMKLKYAMDLDNEGLAASAQSDGSISIYGPSVPIAGTVSTGNEKDSALLQKARANAKKDKYLFSLPAPVVYQSNRAHSSAKSHFELKGDEIITVTTGLKKAIFPLTVDPAVTVVSGSDLFRDTNPESNIDFNGSTGVIDRGQVSGGVVTTSWTSNGNNIGTARFLNGAAIYDDYSYVAGGAAAGSTTNISTVEYAANSKVNQSIGSWSTTTALPAALSRFQLIIYNGYMYAIGGSTTNTTCAGVSSSIYYNRIQTNGQLSASWTTNTVTLPAGVCGLGAAAYNGKLYIAGGRTGSANSTGVTTVAYATINPDGSIGSFTSDDSTLPAARYDFDLKIYNGYLYAVAGTLTGATTNTVLIAPLAADGSVYGGAGSASWKTGTNLSTARTAMGGTLAAVNDGFMYVQGGCNTLNANQTCTTAAANTQGDIEIAQINADGTLGNWSSVATSVANRVQVGGSLIFWRGTIYVFAGCSSISTTAVQCTTALNTQVYDTIASPGQIGPVKTSPTNTPSLTAGVWGHGMAVVNGYLFVIGGCINASCQNSAADLTAVVRTAKLNADGSTGAWGTTTSIPLALSAVAVAVYNNYIYVMGGYDYTTTSNGSAVNTIYYGQVSATGTIASWSTSGNTYVTAANARYYSSAVAYRGVLYVFGGCVAGAHATGCSTYYANVYRSTIGAAGAPGTWSATTAALPNSASTAVALMSATVYNGYVYLAGGGGANVGGQASTVQYARIQTSGDITSFSTTTGIMTTDGTTALPLRRTDAYAMNGYLYVVGGHNGNTGLTYGTIQIGKINLSNGNITSNLSPSITQMTARWDTRAAFSNGYMYVSGGCDGGSPANTCTNPSTKSEYFEIYNAGNKGTGVWTSPAAYATPNRVGGASATYNGYIYMAGGCQNYTVGANFGNTTTKCTTPATDALNTVAYAPLNPDGTIGTWTTGSNNLTGSSGRAFGCLVAQGGYLYYIGGLDATTGLATNTVLYSQIGSNGVPGTWTQSATTLAGGRRGLSCGVFSDRIYITGGVDASNTDQATVYYSPNLSNGGDITSWTSATSFTTARANHVTVVAAGYLYVIGGDDGTNALRDVQFIQINPAGGTTGSWANSVDLPQGVSYQSGIVANGYLYLFGGRTAAASCLGDGGTGGYTYIASINNTGITSNWSQGANNFTTPRFGTAASFYNGYYYMMGGDDCTNVISSNVIQADGERSQSMRASFSKYADLGGNGDPEKLVIYLTNAQNNGVDIEEWQLVYKSSFDNGTPPTWGVDTTIAPLVTENAYSISAFDGSAVDQKMSRWFYLSFSVNMERSFSFTDDTQPTVFQYGLHYAPPTAKRLMHGRDFRDQTQQGEDIKL